MDFERLVRLLSRRAVHDFEKRPRILHVDEDSAVARALAEIGDVVTVKSIDEARRALKDR